LPSLGCHSVLIRDLLAAFFSCVLTVNVIDPSFLATVFHSASISFNGDLSLWDVANVTTMSSSKSICIVENDFDVTSTHAIV
jgi:surface protein